MNFAALMLLFMIDNNFQPSSGLEGIIDNMPYFFIGMALSTSELYNPNWRPLDRLRRYGYIASRQRNLIFTFLFFTYGGYMGKPFCDGNPEGYCHYVSIMSHKHTITTYIMQMIASIQIILMALVSPGFQYFLGSGPIKFLGKISFPFYLIHFVFIDFGMKRWMD